MEKPKYNSPIKDKIKWLEWFIANTTEEERQAMSSVTPRERKCNDGRGRKAIYTPEEIKERKRLASKRFAEREKLKRHEEAKALGKEIKRGRQAVLTPEEVKERQRQRCRERYHRLKANK